MVLKPQDLKQEIPIAKIVKDSESINVPTQHNLVSLFLRKFKRALDGNNPIFKVHLFDQVALIKIKREDPILNLIY